MPDMQGAAVDQEALAVLADDLGGALPQVLRLFLRELPRRRDAILQALADRDARALEHAAHSLKGTSATVCATELAALCDEFEQQALRGLVPAGAATAREVEAACARAEDELRAAAGPVLGAGR
jgi:HPt (histidine-containing phosphotransfer) domain-containing protein